MTWTVKDSILAVAVMILGSGLVGGVLFGVNEAFLAIDPLLIGMMGTLGGFIMALVFAVNRGGRALFDQGAMSTRQVSQAIALGVVGLGLALVWDWLVNVLGSTVPDQGIIQDIAAMDDPFVLAVAGVYITVVAPCTEEYLFRGFMQPAMVQRYGRTLGIWFTAGVFGLMHLADPMTVPLIILIGALAGWLRERTGGVGVPIVYHMANNTFSLVAYAVLGA